MAPSDQQIEQLLDRLAALLEDMKVRYRRFLNGDRDLDPTPEAVRDRVQALLRSLRNQNLRRAVDSFRLANLEAQFNSYQEMFRRRLRLIEEGRAPEVVRASGVLQSFRHDVERGVVVGDRADGAAVEALFQGLCDRSSSSRMDLDTFRRYIDQQVTQIRQKTGCTDVQFRLVSEEGKVKLKAKPIGGAR